MKSFFGPHFSTLLLIPVLWLTGGCTALLDRDPEREELAPDPDRPVAFEHTAPAPDLATVPRGAWLQEVPNRPGYYVEPGNFEGILYSEMPPGTAVRSPYTDRFYRIPYGPEEMEPPQDQGLGDTHPPVYSPPSL